jgi:hypothetical protein
MKRAYPDQRKQGRIYEELISSAKKRDLRAGASVRYQPVALVGFCVTVHLR